MAMHTAWRVNSIDNHFDFNAARSHETLRLCPMTGESAQKSEGDHCQEGTHAVAGAHAGCRQATLLCHRPSLTAPSLCDLSVFSKRFSEAQHLEHPKRAAVLVPSQDFLPDLVEFQVEPAAAVRKYLAELLADAAAAAPRPPVLAAAAACLGTLAADATAAVAKAAIAAAVTVFRTAFSIAAHQVPLLAAFLRLACFAGDLQMTAGWQCKDRAQRLTYDDSVQTA
jgi:hypothetical protein